jgi:hypothetical protein
LTIGYEAVEDLVVGLVPDEGFGVVVPAGDRHNRDTGDPQWWCPVVAVGGTAWLFPSLAAKGRPTSALAIGKRLGRLGITASRFRQAALIQLCAELPAAVVADLLGISIQTAEQWARCAGRDQADYMRLRDSRKIASTTGSADWSARMSQ